MILPKDFEIHHPDPPRRPENINVTLPSEAQTHPPPGTNEHSLSYIQKVHLEDIVLSQIKQKGTLTDVPFCLF